MHQPTNFVKIYCDLILKKIVSKIAVNQHKKAKAQDRAMSTSKTSNQVRSMRHWRAAADNEFYFAEIEKGFQQMKELDEQTGWSKNLHQDRYRFMSEKYKNILEQYLRNETYLRKEVLSSNNKVV